MLTSTSMNATHSDSDPSIFDKVVLDCLGFGILGFNTPVVVGSGVETGQERCLCDMFGEMDKR
jgi:hypothetical protein